jgi:hypothetical protein
VPPAQGCGGSARAAVSATRLGRMHAQHTGTGSRACSSLAGAFACRRASILLRCLRLGLWPVWVMLSWREQPLPRRVTPHACSGLVKM